MLPYYVFLRQELAAFRTVISVDYGFVLPIASVHLKCLQSLIFLGFDMWQDLHTKVSDQAEQIVRLPSDCTTVTGIRLTCCGGSHRHVFHRYTSITFERVLNIVYTYIYFMCIYIYMAYIYQTSFVVVGS